MGEHVLFLRQSLSCCCWHNLNISVPRYFRYWLSCRGFVIFKCNHLSLPSEINSIRARTGKQGEMIVEYLVQTYLLKLSDNYFCLFLLNASYHTVIICGVSTQFQTMRSSGVSILTPSSLPPCFPLSVDWKSFCFCMCLSSDWTVWLWPAVL